MAVREKNGWHWTGQEKQWILTWKHDLQTQERQLAEQVERFKSLLPEFADEAARTGGSFLEAAGRLLSFAERAKGRKYQPLSPDEAETMLADARRLCAEWVAFTTRSDVGLAIQEANRRVDAHNREVKKQRQEYRRNVQEFLVGPEFSERADKYVAEVVEKAAEMAQLASVVASFGEKTDQPRLQRLFLVHFVRATYRFDRNQWGAMEQFVGGTPPPTLGAVLKYALGLVIKDHLLRPSPDGGLSIEAHITAYMTGTFDSMLKGFTQWKKEGVTPEAIGRGYFSIQGADYSLDAQPE